MDFTTDKLSSLVGKWHTLIEAYVDVQTTDNFPLRLFCIGFTKRLPNQVRRAYHAQTARLDRKRDREGNLKQIALTKSVYLQSEDPETSQV
ncbi:hypothetical protein CUMW_177870 [Citrus unshiu]|uniref:Uncharacterized protein n=1 Tax=Citrus unshiu TaxID=55188 RepID=A0A2H5PXZ7_CITUN|nr:hypothetical protein CUMW_177870 [Citrus unshiu]